MTDFGFQLNPGEIAEWVGHYIPEKGEHLKMWLDSYARPDFTHGVMMVHDPVDRAVLVFVGSREKVEAATAAVRQATCARPLRGPMHDIDSGEYRAVIRDGVPMIERDNTAACVRAVLVPCSPEVVGALSAEWSEHVQFKIEQGEFIMRKAGGQS